ncbi:hypothetical protein N7467_002575 [Penicillium canescens]|nr:hypothetical protein N7467_002575 [Penicillium canescens]
MCQSPSTETESREDFPHLPLTSVSAGDDFGYRANSKQLTRCRIHSGWLVSILQIANPNLFLRSFDEVAR